MYYNMFNKIKSLIKLPKDKEKETSGIPLYIDPPLDIIPIEEPKDTITLLRHQLGSIDLKDLEQKEMSEGERKDYCAVISGIYPKLEKDIKKFLYEQLMWTSNNSQNWEQVLFGRGTFNGMDILLNHWKKAHDEHLERIKPKDSFDRHQLTPETDDS